MPSEQAFVDILVSTDKYQGRKMTGMMVKIRKLKMSADRKEWKKGHFGNRRVLHVRQI